MTIYSWLFKKKIICCMGIVILINSESEKVLILRNKEGWVIPKGHVDEGEDFLKCAIREVGEESGVLLNSHESIGKIHEFYYYTNVEKKIKKIIVFGFIINKPQEITHDEHEGFIEGKFVEISEAFKILLYENEKNALNKMVKKLKEIYI